MKHLTMAVLLLVAVFGLVGCQAMPVTMSPFASYGGNGIDYPNRNDQNHQWQVGVAASFVLGGNGAVANAVPTPGLPSRISVSNSATNSNTNSNNAQGGDTTNNVNNGVINNGTVNGGIK